jgi:hypothetical protein
MLNKTTLALAIALTLGVSSAALAAKGGGAGAEGNREFGSPGQTASSGVNPADHRSLGGDKVDQIMSDGKCWLNTSNGNYGWEDCPRSRH